MRVEGVRGTKAVKAAANAASAASGVNATGEVSDMVHLWVRPNRAFMNGYFGIRCKTKHPDCVVCMGWSQFDATGTVEVLADNRALLGALLNGDI